MYRAILTTSLVLLLAGAAVARAEIELPQLSPPASVSQRIGLTDIEVRYSSPGVKGRQIWGGLVPYGELWRTGANAATTVTFSEDVVVAGEEVPAGTYSLFTIPTEGDWTFILNADAELSGTRGYDKAEDVVRIEVTPEVIPHRERLTFAFANFHDDGGDLTLEWEKRRLSIPITVGTEAQAAANIDAAVAESARDLASAARYVLDNGLGAERALVLAEKATAVDATWFNNYILARALAANEQWADAASVAERAYEQGLQAEYFFWKDQVAASVEEWKAKAGVE